jgi:acetolactate synthase-1/3 small subunit
MIKVSAPHEMRGELMQLAQIFRARVDHVDAQSLILEVTGNREKLEAFIDILRPHGIQEMARTGQIAMARSQGPMADYWSDAASGYDSEDDGTYNISRAAERLAQEIEKQD